MSRYSKNAHVVIAVVLVVLMFGAVAGRALHLYHHHSVHARALTVDSMCLAGAFAYLAASVFVFPIPQRRKLASPIIFETQIYSSLLVALPVSRPPPAHA